MQRYQEHLIVGEIGTSKTSHEARRVLASQRKIAMEITIPQDAAIINGSNKHRYLGPDYDSTFADFMAMASQLIESGRYEKIHVIRSISTVNSHGTGSKFVNRIVDIAKYYRLPINEFPADADLSKALV